MRLVVVRTLGFLTILLAMFTILVKIKTIPIALQEEVLITQTQVKK